MYEKSIKWMIAREPSKRRKKIRETKQETKQNETKKKQVLNCDYDKIIKIGQHKVNRV